jgi:outer membrane autotransporter protein
MTNRLQGKVAVVAGGGRGISEQKTSNPTSRVELGVEVSNAPAVKNGDVNLMARLAWGHYLERDAGLSASLVGLNNASFFVQGAKPDENSALLALGAQMKLSDNLSISARADGDVSSSTQSVAGSLQARFTF